MTKFSAQIASAQRAIKAKGVLLTFTRTPTAAHTDVDLSDDSTPVPAAPIQASGWGVVLPPTTQTEQTYQQQFSSGSLKITNVQRILLSPVGMAFIPDEGDRTVIKGQPWEILGGKTLNPDTSEGGEILVELTVKR